MKIIDYNIAETSELHILEEHVKELISQGYIPFGGVGGYWTQ